MENYFVQLVSVVPPIDKTFSLVVGNKILMLTDLCFSDTYFMC